MMAKIPESNWRISQGDSDPPPASRSLSQPPIVGDGIDTELMPGFLPRAERPAAASARPVLLSLVGLVALLAVALFLFL